MKLEWLDFIDELQRNTHQNKLDISICGKGIVNVEEKS